MRPMSEVEILGNRLFGKMLRVLQENVTSLEKRLNYRIPCKKSAQNTFLMNIYNNHFYIELILLSTTWKCTLIAISYTITESLLIIMLEARSISLCLPSIDPLHFQRPRNVSFNDKLAYMLIFYQPPAFFTMNAFYQIESKRQQHEIRKSRQEPPQNNKKQPKPLMQTQQRSVRHRHQFDKSPSHRSLRTVELSNVLKHQSKIKNKSHKSIFNQSQSDYQELLEDLNFLQQFSHEHQQNNQQLQSKPLRAPQVDFKHDESSLFKQKQSNDDQRHPTVQSLEKQHDQNLVSSKCHVVPRQIIYSPRTLKSYRFNSSNQIQFMRKNRLHKLSWVLGEKINCFLAQSFRNIYCYAEIPKKTTCQQCQRQLIEEKRQKTCPRCKIQKKPKHTQNFTTKAN